VKTRKLILLLVFLSGLLLGASIVAWLTRSASRPGPAGLVPHAGLFEALARSEAPDPTYRLKSIDLREEALFRGKLRRDYLMRGTTKMPIALWHLLYDCGLTKIRTGRTIERERHCYEIRPLDPSQSEYVWALWSSRWLTDFFILQEGSGSTWLAWIDVTDIYFSEISAPKHRLVALAEHLSGRRPGVFHVPVWSLVERNHLLRVGDSHATGNIEVLAIERRDSGQMTVKAFFAPTEVNITFGSDGKTWRRL